MLYYKFFNSHLNRYDAELNRGNRDRGYLTNFYAGRFLPEVQPLTLLYIIFHKKGIPFVYLPLTNGTPFTYLG